MDWAHTGRQTKKEKEWLVGFPIEKPIEAQLHTLYYQRECKRNEKPLQECRLLAQIIGH